MTTYTLHFDGSCGPKNPGGTAAYGYIITKNGATLAENHDIIGSGPAMSNNLAEFAALCHGLRECHLHSSKGDVINVRGDSKLVINVMSRRWKAKADTLYWPAYVDADWILRQVRKAGVLVNFDWIPREQNTECDVLSKWDNLSIMA